MQWALRCVGSGWQQLPDTFPPEDASVGTKSLHQLFLISVPAAAVPGRKPGSPP